MTDTTTRADFSVIRGKFIMGDDRERTMRAVEYTHFTEGMRFDWWAGDTPDEEYERLIESARARWERGEDHARYEKPSAWTFVPDVAIPATDVADGGRAAQASAIATMRRREASALRAQETAIAQRDAVQRELSALRERVMLLNDDLNEQAVERDWCSEFEDFVGRFPDLLSVATQEVTVTLTLSLGRGASTDYHSIADHIYDLDRGDLRSLISDVTED